MEMKQTIDKSEEKLTDVCRWHTEDYEDFCVDYMDQGTVPRSIKIIFKSLKFLSLPGVFFPYFEYARSNLS